MHISGHLQLSFEESVEGRVLQKIAGLGIGELQACLQRHCYMGHESLREQLNPSVPFGTGFVINEFQRTYVQQTVWIQMRCQVDIPQLGEIEPDSFAAQAEPNVRPVPKTGKIRIQPAGARYIADLEQGKRGFDIFGIRGARLSVFRTISVCCIGKIVSPEL